jgi:hypothetical protein
MSIHVDRLRVFIKGLSYDLNPKATQDETYQHAENLRLYSKKGRLSLVSIKGTTVFYENAAIKKYLGACAFEDQLVLMIKLDNDYAQEINTGISYQFTVVPQSVTHNYQSTDPDPGLDLQAGLLTEQVFDSVLAETQEIEVIDKSNESCQTPVSAFNLNDYYALSNISVPNYEHCILDNEDTVPTNNGEYGDSISDAILVLTKDEDGNITDEIVWNGFLNLDPNRKLVMVGLDENAHYRRVYMTDGMNPYRTFNLKDPNLRYKIASTFDIVQDISLLRPEVALLEENGQLPAMSVQYFYRLITEDGQVSLISPFSKLIQVVKEDRKHEFAGGDIDEITNKAVTISCPIPEYLKYNQIEAYALEFKAPGIPSGIKQLGVKDVQEIVTFKHIGTESDYSDTLTLTEILTNTNTFRYCNALEIHNNKLVAGGLRNQPYPLGVRYLEDQFVLKAYDADGKAHNCLINPSPDVYRYVKPSDTSKSLSAVKTQYTRILVFGNFNIRLPNLDTGDFIKTTFYSDTDQYENYIPQVAEWLEGEDLSIFPNLKVEYVNSTLLMSLENEAVTVDLLRYRFSISQDQAIVEFDNEYVINTDSVDPTDLVFGASSHGYNQGTGIRLSWERESELLLSKTPEQYTGGNILPLETPSLKKGFMKEEIYRLGLTFYKSGAALFTIPMGDIQAPALGDTVSYIDQQGNAIITDEKYRNQFVDGNSLYGERVVLKAEVRLGCEMKKFVDAYQIHYVPRDEFNRTILAQGISAPLQRVMRFKDINEFGENKTPETYRKWTLPYKGGPLLERFGFEAYDTYGDQFEEDVTDSEEVMKRRIMTHRKLMYFDSPEFIYNKVSDALLENSTVEVKGRLKTDHSRVLFYDMMVPTPNANPFNGVNQNTFSKKIWEGGSKPDEELEAFFAGEDKNTHPYWMDVSVFAGFEPFESSHDISESAIVGNGEIIPAVLMGMSHPISNNALSLGEPSMYYSSHWRKGKTSGGTVFNQGDIAACQFGFTSQRSSGYRTLFIKTKEDLFTDEFLGPEIIDVSSAHFRGDRWTTKPTVDSHALINLRMDNADTVYGGRTKYALSRNLYSPLSKVIPVHKKGNQAQISKVNGDVYTTLFMRTKNSWHNHKPFKEFKEMQNHDDRTDNSRDINEWNRPSAWMYAVVLETQVEERFNHHNRPYRVEPPFDFGIEQRETINPAYLIEDELKDFIPRPFTFQDDPLRTDQLAASKVKLAGDYYDSFTVFLANDFYPLGKKYGDITNLVVDKDQLFAIQERATNAVVMDPKDTIQTEEGREIQLATGTGRVFHDHKVISKYGTGIRGSVTQSDFGFSFFDERRNEFIRGATPLTLERDLAFKMREYFDNDPVVNVEGWYDDYYKETNLMLISKSGIKRTLSFNELQQVFNGWYDYQASKYFRFDNIVFAPEADGGYEPKLHMLNTGNELELFGVQKNAKLGLIVKEAGPAIFESISLSLNQNLPVDQVTIYDNRDQSDIRVIASNHFRYEILEGVHHVPLSNMMDRAEKRGEWAYIEINMSIQSPGQRIELMKMIAHLRASLI